MYTIRGLFLIFLCKSMNEDFDKLTNVYRVALFTKDQCLIVMKWIHYLKEGLIT